MGSLYSKVNKIRTNYGGYNIPNNYQSGYYTNKKEQLSIVSLTYCSLLGFLELYQCDLTNKNKKSKSFYKLDQ